MDLQVILENTPQILEKAIFFGVVSYPVYAGLRAMGSKDKFTQLLKDSETIAMASGIGVGRFIYEYVTLLF